MQFRIEKKKFLFFFFLLFRYENFINFFFAPAFSNWCIGVYYFSVKVWTKIERDERFLSGWSSRKKLGRDKIANFTVVALFFFYRRALEKYTRPIGFEKDFEVMTNGNEMENQYIIYQSKYIGIHFGKNIFFFRHITAVIYFKRYKNKIKKLFSNIVKIWLWCSISENKCLFYLQFSM